MNIWLILGGTLGTLGGVAHGVLGHRFTVGALRAEHLASAQFDGEVNRRFLMWFWQIGTLVLVSASVLLLLQGLGIVDLHRHLLLYLAGLWAGITLVFLMVSWPAPRQSFRMVPGLVGIPINLLIWFGLFLE